MNPPHRFTPASHMTDDRCRSLLASLSGELCDALNSTGHLLKGSEASPLAENRFQFQFPLDRLGPGTGTVDLVGEVDGVGLLMVRINGKPLRGIMVGGSGSELANCLKAYWEDGVGVGSTQKSVPPLPGELKLTTLSSSKNREILMRLYGGFREEAYRNDVAMMGFSTRGPHMDIWVGSSLEVHVNVVGRLARRTLVEVKQSLPSKPPASFMMEANGWMLFKVLWFSRDWHNSPWLNRLVGRRELSST